MWSAKEPNTINVIKPKPPVCIKQKIINFPKAVHWLMVLVTTKPVTQVAEVAVNKASKTWMLFPFWLEIGRQSKLVPIKITSKKPKIITLVGLFLNIFSLI